MAGWLIGALNHIDTAPLLALVVPVIGALFLLGQMNSTREAAQQAATQTNGNMDARLLASALQALSIRDTTKIAAQNSLPGQPVTPIPPADPATETEEN